MGTTEIDTTGAVRQGPAPDLIVALGASAGGLDALDRFFSTVSPTDNAAFVVIQHLAPEHKTMMDTLLARHTRMKVVVASEGEWLIGGRVYVIPPGATMTVQSGQLRLVPRPATGVTLPINTFFESMTAEKDSRAIGIVLSGTGSDGSEGARRLAASGAWIIAQDPETARFDGMPRNVIATGVVDHVLPPEDIAREVMSIARSGERPDRASGDDAGLLDGSAQIGAVLRLLAGVIPISFEKYKPTTLLRRLERRMNATGCQTLQAYCDHLSSAPEEIARLRHELLIPVTRFFRDPDAFEMLRDQVLAPLIEERAATEPDLPLRAWVTACSTGEEAYSVAILLLEAMQAAGAALPIKLFATDVEPDYVALASAGRYSENQLANVDAARRARWFEQKEDGKWCVTAALRHRVVFSRHDILRDAPFTQMDLILCRNMLIYLKPDAQDRVLRRLSYGLKQGGVLFLGSSETPGAMTDGYTAIDARNKLYKLQSRPVSLPPDDLNSGDGRLRSGPYRTSQRAPYEADRPGSARLAEDALIEGYAPPSILLDRNRVVLHMFGDIARYMSLHKGMASLDVLQLVPPEIGPVLSTLLHAAAREKKMQRSHPIALPRRDGPDEQVQLVARPLDPENVRVTRLMVTFERPRPIRTEEVLDKASISEMTARQIADLERELELTRANLQETIQDLGTANEELQASNEELMASNEELQSTNEELQSVNEELHTVNAEYQAKIGELNQLNADLEGLTRAARIPLVFLDRDLCLTRFTPQATDLFRLRPGDIGRPLRDINSRLDDPDLIERAAAALSDNTPHQYEIPDDRGGHWLVSILPYTSRNMEHTRIVISCIDVSALRDVQRLQSILDAAPGNLAVLDTVGTITMVNDAWTAFAEQNGGVVHCGIGVNYLDRCRASAAHDPFARKAVDGLTAILEGRKTGVSLLYPCHSPTQKRWFLMNAATLPEGGVVVSHLNLTDWIDVLRVEKTMQG